jgi:DNA-binding MarR family transcriptional regulator
VSGRRHTRRNEASNKQKLRLWLRLLRTSRSIEAELRRRFAAEFATTLPKFDVMAALSRAPNGMKMSELSRHLMVSNGNVTGIIERLVAEETVERLAQAGDRRATCVRLTEEGRTRFAAMAEAHAGWIAAILRDLSGTEAETLSRLLARAAPPGAAAANGGSRAFEASGASAAALQKRLRFEVGAPRFARRRGSGGTHVR